MADKRTVPEPTGTFVLLESSQESSPEKIDGHDANSSSEVVASVIDHPMNGNAPHPEMHVSKNNDKEDPKKQKDSLNISPTVEVEITTSNNDSVEEKAKTAPPTLKTLERKGIPRRKLIPTLNGREYPPIQKPPEHPRIPTARILKTVKNGKAIWNHPPNPKAKGARKIKSGANVSFVQSNSILDTVPAKSSTKSIQKSNHVNGHEPAKSMSKESIPKSIHVNGNEHEHEKAQFIPSWSVQTNNAEKESEMKENSKNDKQQPATGTEQQDFKTPRKQPLGKKRLKRRTEASKAKHSKEELSITKCTESPENGTPLGIQKTNESVKDTHVDRATANGITTQPESGKSRTTDETNAPETITTKAPLQSTPKTPTNINQPVVDLTKSSEKMVRKEVYEASFEKQEPERSLSRASSAEPFDTTMDTSLKFQSTSTPITGMDVRKRQTGKKPFETSEPRRRSPRKKNSSSSNTSSSEPIRRTTRRPVPKVPFEFDKDKPGTSKAMRNLPLSVENEPTDKDKPGTSKAMRNLTRTVENEPKEQRSPSRSLSDQNDSKRDEESDKYTTKDYFFFPNGTTIMDAVNFMEEEVRKLVSESGVPERNGRFWDQSARVTAAFSELRDHVEATPGLSSKCNILSDQVPPVSETEQSDDGEDITVENDDFLRKLRNPRTRRAVCSEYAERKATFFFESGQRVQVDPDADLHARGWNKNKFLYKDCPGADGTGRNVVPETIPELEAEKVPKFVPFIVQSQDEEEIEVVHIGSGVVIRKVDHDAIVKKFKKVWPRDYGSNLALEVNKHNPEFVAHNEALTTAIEAIWPSTTKEKFVMLNGLVTCGRSMFHQGRLDVLLTYLERVWNLVVKDKKRNPFDAVKLNLLKAIIARFTHWSENRNRRFERKFNYSREFKKEKRKVCSKEVVNQAIINKRMQAKYLQLGPKTLPSNSRTITRHLRRLSEDTEFTSVDEDPLCIEIKARSDKNKPAATFHFTRIRGRRTGSSEQREVTRPREDLERRNIGGKPSRESVKRRTSDRRGTHRSKSSSRSPSPNDKPPVKKKSRTNVDDFMVTDVESVDAGLDQAKRMKILESQLQFLLENERRRAEEQNLKKEEDEQNRRPKPSSRR